ncbi:MAG: ABC transporter substrate-binding protein [Pseudomonadota bacterium]
MRLSIRRARARCVAMLGLAVPLTTLCAVAQAASPAPPPTRIVSINLCADQILLELVDAERIAAVSHLAADPTVSAVANQARGLTLTRGDGEDVLRYGPDLVLASAFTPRARVDHLRRLGMKVILVPHARDIEGIRSAIRVVADAVQARARGDHLIARFDATLARARKIATRSGRAAAGSKPRAILYSVNALAAGSYGLTHTAMTIAGLTNAAPSLGRGPGGRLPLERLLQANPDVILLSHAVDAYGAIAVAANLRHPAFRWLMRTRPTFVLRQAVTLCGTPKLADAIAALADKVARRRAGQSEQPAPPLQPLQWAR